MTQERCRNGKHIYISKLPKPRICIWCNHKEKIKKPKLSFSKKKKVYKKSIEKKKYD